MTSLDDQEPMRAQIGRPRHPSHADLDAYVAAWNLVPDGKPLFTDASALLPVRTAERLAMLKISRDPQEHVGGALLEWWGGDGAAHVFAREGDTILMERATGRRSLATMSRSGEDEKAIHILCAVAERLRVPRMKEPPALVPLELRFRDLALAAGKHGGIFRRCDAAARSLLAAPQDVTILHGDLHHDNVLDFDARGWLAIDPKGLVGERGFDYANLFCNPDLSDASTPVATRPAIFRARLDLVVELAGLERRRLLTWILAWAGLSAAWIVNGGESPVTSLAVAERAASELDC